jgi:hypothetical protein
VLNKEDLGKDNIKTAGSIIKVMMTPIKIETVSTAIEDVLQDSTTEYLHHPTIAITQIDE